MHRRSVDRTAGGPYDVSRRRILAMGALEVCSLIASTPTEASSAECDFPVREGIPRLDYHVHIGDGITVEQAVRVAGERGMKFGLLQHAGAKGHGYTVSDDAELSGW